MTRRDGGRPRGALRVLLAAALSIGGGCEAGADADDRRRGGRAPEIGALRCELGPSHRLARSTGLAFHGVALVPPVPTGDAGGLPSADGRPSAPALAVWSEPAGLFLRPVHPRDGSPAGPPERLGAACSAGLTVSPDGRFLACREAADPVRARPGAIRVRDLRGPGRELGFPAGSGKGIALGLRTPEREAGSRAPSPLLDLAWTEGRTLRRQGIVLSPEGRRLRLADPAAIPAPPETAPTAFPGRPAVGRIPAKGDRATPFLVWSARGVEGTTTYGGLYAQVGDGGVARPIADARALAGRPTVHPDGRGVVIAWRDRPAGWERPHAFARRFDARLRPQGPAAQWLARADAGGGIGLVPCFGGWIALVPHRDGGASVSLAIRRLRPNLEPAAPELSLYEYRRDFVEVAARCLDPGHRGSLLLLYGERGRSDRPAPALLGTTYRCTSRSPSKR